MWARKASEKLRPLAGRQRRAERNRSFEFVRCETGEEFRLCTRVPFPRKRRKQSLSVCLLQRVASALELHIACHRSNFKIVAGIYLEPRSKDDLRPYIILLPRQ
jgi:hypothetical protein